MNQVCPFKNLKKEELEKECAERGLFRQISFKKKPQKQDYMDALTSHMKGITRVPALLFKCLTLATALSCLKVYEVFATEPLHDLKNHIQNIFDELPSTLKGAEKSTFLNAKEKTINRKDVKRGCDYRRALIVITHTMKGKCNQKVYDLLLTLCQISKIAYKRAILRCPRDVLRLYNICYKHGALCVDVFKHTLKLTQRKIFGIYFHAIVTHMPDTHRLIALSSVHVESEERYFGAINAISKRTSDRKAPHIISNSIVRLQAQKLQRRPNSSQEESIVSKVSHLLPTEENTRFDASWIRRPDFQFHLQRIPDFLKHGENVWWSLEGTTIIFKDGQNEMQSQSPGPRLMHLYNFTFPTMQQHLRDTWRECITDTSIRLPISKLKKYDGFGNLVSFHQFKPWFPNDEAYYTCEEEGPIADDSQLPLPTVASDDTSIDPEPEEMQVEEEEDDEGPVELRCLEDEQQIDFEIHNQQPTSSDSGYSSMANETEIVTTSGVDFTTSLARNVFKALPDEIVLLRRFDMLRLRSRDGEVTRDYKDCEAVIQQRVLRQEADLKKKLRDWEIEFFDATKCEPTKDNYVTAGMWVSYNQYKICKQLLTAWKISF